MDFTFPRISGKAFLGYMDDLVADLKSLFRTIGEQAQIIADESTTIEELTFNLEGLFEPHPTDRAQKAYKPRSVSPKQYAQMIGEILVQNGERVGASVLEADRKRFVVGMEQLKIRGPREIAPDIQYALKRSSSIIKAADRGKEISQTRREEMRKVIKNVLATEPVQTRTGAVRKDIQRKVKKALREYFAGYTKDSPPYGVPKNLETIAVTETKSLLNNVRREYMQMAEGNLPEGTVMMKRWRHNASLAKEPRPSHRAMDGKAIPMSGKFRVDGHWCTGPHDYSLPPDQSIGCHCDLVYTVEKKA